MQTADLGAELFFQEDRGKFNRDKPVALVRAPGGGQARLALEIETKTPGHEFHGLTSIEQTAVALQIQTQLQAARMKALCPIQIARGMKVVPFKAKAQVVILSE